ncbi:hypothetical protein QBC98_005675 [Kitasatospora acidiphila]
MSDGKAPEQSGAKKTDKPPMPVQQPAPKDQHAGPAQAAEHTPAGQAAALQKSVGNQQANRLMRAAREPEKNPHAMAGVKVSHPDDAHEKEAEAVAKHITSGGDSGHEHGATAKTAPSGGAPGDPPKVVGDPEMAHRAVAPHPATPTAAAQHPATQVATTPHPGAAQPHTAAPQHTAPQTPAAQHPATPQHAAPTPHPAQPHTAAPHPAAPQHAAPQAPAAQHPAPHAATTQHPGPAHPNPASILDHPGPGQPIPQPTRGILEARLKADLSHVVVHHDAAADQAVRALHARAVTRGDHIFLASDASPNDLSLMAHEVTHVLHHQGGVVHRQANSAPAAAPTPPANAKPKGNKNKYKDPKRGTITFVPANDASGVNTVELSQVAYPDEKLDFKPPAGVDVQTAFAASTKIVPKENRKEKKSVQEKKWRTEIQKSTAIAQKIDSLVDKSENISDPGKPKTPGSLVALRYGKDGAGAGTGTDGAGASAGAGAGNGNTKVIKGAIVGTRDELVAAAEVPYWDNTGNFNRFDIDHLLELQVGGKDDITNFWLWESVANQSSGSLLDQQITKRVDGLLLSAKEYYERESQITPPETGIPADRAALRADARWQLKIGELVHGFEFRGNPKIHWTSAQIMNAEAANMLHTVSDTELKDLGLTANKSKLTIIAGSQKGGAVVSVDWGKNQTESSARNIASIADAFHGIYDDFHVTKIEYDPKNSQDGKLTGHLITTSLVEQQTRNVEITLKKFRKQPTDTRVAMLNGQHLAQKVGFFEFRGLSPISIDEADLIPYEGFYAHGVLHPSIPLLRNTPIDVEYSHGALQFEKSFGASNLPIPAPFKVTSGGITVSAGTNGFQVGGTLSLALGTVARGSISASVDAKRAFTLDGQLDFDKTLFQPATLGFSYRKAGSDYSWGINGTLGIPANKIPGIKNALVNASYTNNKFALDGHADLAIPGLQSSSLAITYADQTGLSIGGTLAFAPNAFIESGSLDATVTKQPPVNHWSVAAHGTVKPKIPGVNTTLNASYQDGIYTIEGTVAYARGMLSGSLTVGLTNQPLGSDGRPAAGPPKPGAPKGAGAPQASGPLRPYGSGTLTARLTPWLQGTAGVQIQKDGSVQLMGEIKLPDSINLFNAMEVQKNIFNVGVKIPIVGVSVLGQSIGIFADVTAGLTASAGVGPGQLKGLGLKVQYNPEHEDQTQITGTAQLNIPAHAGLRLYVNGGLGAGIPVVSAEAGLQIGGQLGIQGAVQAGVTVNWTPKKGLVIDAQASLTASPTFTFDINGYVKVTADLWFDTVNLYEKHWQLASVQYGSGLQVGVSAPIHYEEGKPFSFSPSDVKFQLPNIDPTSILTDLVHKIA